MTLAVLLYQFVTNELHVPDDWPAETRMLTENETVEAPWIVMSEEEYQTYITNPDRLQRKNLWNNHHTEPNMAIKLTGAVSNSANPMFSYNDSENITKIRVCENTDFTVFVEVQTLQGALVTGLNYLYAMPLAKEGGSTILLGVDIKQGLASIKLNLSAGLYQVTEELINRDLTTNHFAFKQVNIYVMKSC